MPEGASGSGFTDVKVSHNSVLVLIFFMGFVDSKKKYITIKYDLQMTSPVVIFSELTKLPFIKQAG